MTQKSALYGSEKPFWLFLKSLDKPAFCRLSGQGKKDFSAFGPHFA